jgi:plasmid stabilization system protein ParE
VKYEVVVTPEAQSGIRGAFRYIQARAPLNAERWLIGLYKQIDTLESFPERRQYAREREFFGGNIRQLLYKSHRIVFEVDVTGKRVSVIYFHHAARRAIGEPPAESG